MTSLPTETDHGHDVRDITPGRSWLSLYLKEFWQARELLYFLTWRDIKVRYKQTAVGVLWVVLQPVLTTAILTAIFSTFARFDTAPIAYPLFALSGIVVWVFVYSAITMTSNSFVSNANMVTKIYFPRLIVPLSSTLACAFDLLIMLALLVLLMIYFSTGVSWQIALAPLFIILIFIQTAAFGILFSAVTIRFRDVKFTLPFVLQIWMLASPVFYPGSLLPEKWRLLFAINPLTGMIEGFRASLFGTPYDWQAIGISVASIALIVAFSLFVFRRMEDDFADLI
jgi:lipopolysaccharide transport system permease protein